MKLVEISPRENFRLLRKIGNWLGVVILLVSLFGFGSEIIRIMGAEPVHGGPARALTNSVLEGLWTFLWIFLWFGFVFVVTSVVELVCDIADSAIERNRKMS